MPTVHLLFITTKLYGSRLMTRNLTMNGCRRCTMKKWLFLAIIASQYFWMTMGFVSVEPFNSLLLQQRGRLKIPAAATTTATGLRSSLSSEEVRSRLVGQLEKLREKDRRSKVVSSQDLVVVFEDNHLVVVDKPSGVLCVPTEQGIPSLAQTVFETVEHNLSSYDRMVVHRLGMETSGLVIFAKTMEALRAMNTMFRTRQLTRQYEALVVGHVKEDSGIIDMPLMRDYVFPPYMRVSTDEHQKALIHLDPSIVGKKLLEAPKPSQTEFEVVSREYLADTELPVSRLTLTSVTGRTHQLNVHCAAFGHPIVGDRVYGFGGEAAPNGGLISDWAENEVASNIKLQKQIFEATTDMKMCVHAKYLEFRHPSTGQTMKFESNAPF